MKTDLDKLMQARGINTLIVVVNGHNFSAPLDYLVGRVHISGGMAVKKVNEAPVLVVNAMEIEEAAHSGLKVYSFYDMGYADIIKEAQGDFAAAAAGLWINTLQKLNVAPGKIGLYGSGDLNYYLELTQRIQERAPQYEFVGEMGSTIFEQAYVTKDADELTRIRAVAGRTSEVVRATWDFISSHRADTNEFVVKDDNTPLTIGDVKRFIRRELLDRELEDTGMIFAQGRDAGFPHSRGEDTMALRLGQSIVFDLFPREFGGGYHHDMTRTWCIGYAPDDVRRAYDTVMEAFDIALEAFGVGKPSNLLQEAVLEYFEGMGHPTQRNKPGTLEGYVHSLGHGLGLNIHESPRLSHLVKDDILQVGNVITIEPGLYYPDAGYGIRVEDTFYITEDGQLLSLTDVPKDLVLPLRG